MSREVSEDHRNPPPSPSAEADGEGVRRGRPGRRTAEERTTAVLELLGGRGATADQLAFRFGVLPATIEAWRQEALVAIAQSMRQGSSKSPELLALERKYADLERVLHPGRHQARALGAGVLQSPFPAWDVVAMSRTTSRG